MHRLANIAHRAHGFVFTCECGIACPPLARADAQDWLHDHCLGLRSKDLDLLMAENETAWTRMDRSHRQWAAQQERFAPWPEWASFGANA